MNVLSGQLAENPVSWPTFFVVALYFN
jgi:hypothetical protein